MFKASFLLWIIVDLSWFGLNLSFIQFLYLQVSAVAGWSKWEMVLLALSTSVFQAGLRRDGSASS